MGAADAWTLFASLDADGDNVISCLGAVRGVVLRWVLDGFEMGSGGF